MIRINLLPREERQVRRSIALPKLGALMPVFVLLFVVALFAAFSLIQTMQVGRLKADIARAQQEAEKLRPQIETINELTQKREELKRRLNVITTLDKNRLWRGKRGGEVSRRGAEQLGPTTNEENPADDGKIGASALSTPLVAGV